MKSKLFKSLGVVAVVVMIAVALVAPAAALAGVTLAVSSTTIGATSNTTVTFTLGATQAAATNAIVVTFGTGWTVPVGVITGTTISTSNGIDSTAITNIAINATGVGQVVTLDTTSAGVSLIGAGAIVQLTFTKIINPAIIGNYSVNVKTASETTAVTSNTVTTTTQPTTTTIGSSAPIFPTNSATGVPVSGFTFTWAAVAGTGVTYQFAIAQASANTSANEFAILDYSDNTLTNAEPSQETFQYNTVYWWEVRAVTMNSSGSIAATGPWAVSMFTTMPTPLTTTSASLIVTSVVITPTVVNSPVTTSRVTTPLLHSVFFSFWIYFLVAIGIIVMMLVINLGRIHIRRKRRAQTEIERLKDEIINEINRALKQ